MRTRQPRRAGLIRAITQHREGRGSEFCRENGLVRLVYVERHEDIHEAIVREKRMKDWHRQWKLRLIRKDNFATLAKFGVQIVSRTTCSAGSLWPRFRGAYNP